MRCHASQLQRHWEVYDRFEALCSLCCYSTLSFVVFQKAQLVQKKAEGGRGEGEHDIREVEKEGKAKVKVASSSNDARLRKTLEELTAEMRAKFQGTTIVGAGNVNRQEPQGELKSMEERVLRNIAEGQRVVVGGSVGPPTARSASVLTASVSSQLRTGSAPGQGLKNGQGEGHKKETAASSIAASAAARTAQVLSDTKRPPSSRRSDGTVSSRHMDDQDEHYNVPERDTSVRSKDADKLRLVVSEIYARHQSDLKAIKDSNLGIEIPQSQEEQLLSSFSARRSEAARMGSTQLQPSNIPPPVAVPKADAKVVESDAYDPHKLHQADTPSDDATSADQFNFMATARRKIMVMQHTKHHHSADVHRVQDSSEHNVTLSEGPLSESVASSVNVVADSAVDGGVHRDSGTNQSNVSGGRKSKRSKRRGSSSSNRTNVEGDGGESAQSTAEAKSVRFLFQL